MNGPVNDDPVQRTNRPGIRRAASPAAAGGRPGEGGGGVRAGEGQAGPGLHRGSHPRTAGLRERPGAGGTSAGGPWRPLALGPVLDGLLERLGLATQARRHRVLHLWDRVVGDAVAAHARPYRLEGDVLWVAVSHPGWAQELAFLKGIILRDLNAAAGAPVLRDVRFTAGPLRRGSPLGAPPRRGAVAASGSSAGTGAMERPGGRRDGGRAASPARSPEQVSGPAGGPDAGLPAAASVSVGAAPASVARLADPDLRVAAGRWLAAARRRREWALRRGWVACAGCGSLFPPQPGSPAGVTHPRPPGTGAAPAVGPPPAGDRLPEQVPCAQRADAAGRRSGPVEGALCPSCRAAREERRRRQVRAILERDPWLTCPQVAAVVGEPTAAVARLYREERAALQDLWRSRLRVAAARLRQGEPPPPETRSLLLRYALLRSGRDPADLDPAAAREAVGARLAPLWDACFGSFARGGRR
ncbi:DUF721 domain-containing protein [Thermaerobacter marianensis]|uniref:DUF721 domain-containing protein n=1 Tax=Thermaerobacter marianensis TaxID=73919 RepID=UPI0002D77294|nr:DUF721 domain-containing protein [Thermaerobacter marianensis]